MSRRAVEALIAVVIGVLIVGGGAIAWWFYSAEPVHSSAATVVSNTGAHNARYAAAIDDSRRLARDVIVAGNMPGLSVAVAVDGELAWAESFGWADIERHAPVTPNTRFRLGAASKPLTAAAVALLHDRGRLDLDAPVQHYMRDYPQKQWPLSTRQLLGDVGGVHRIRGDNNDAMPRETCADLGEALPLIAGEPLMFRPGSQYRYSIWGWVLLSVLVERVTGEPFPEFMARELFRPLEMQRTVLETSRGLPDDSTTLYGQGHSGRVGADDPSNAQYSCLAGAGAFLSTPSDLARFGSAMLRPGLLKRETIEMMQEPLHLESGQATSYALGWKVESVTIAGKPARLIGHRGTPRSGAVSLLTFPDLGVVVAAAANLGGARIDPFAQKLAEVFTITR